LLRTIQPPQRLGIAKSHNQWAGETEFERSRNQALFQREGRAKVLELAKQFRLPQDIVILHSGHLREYDFERGGFMIDIAKTAGGISGFSVADKFRAETVGTLRGANLYTLNRAVWIECRNTAGDTFWAADADTAQAATKGHPASGQRRKIYIGTVAKLHDLRENAQGQAVFDGELIKVGLYWDAKLEEELAVLPLQPN
jgi:hypothetical protein